MVEERHAVRPDLRAVVLAAVEDGGKSGIAEKFEMVPRGRTGWPVCSPEVPDQFRNVPPPSKLTVWFAQIPLGRLGNSVPSFSWHVQPSVGALTDPILARFFD